MIGRPIKGQPWPKEPWRVEVIGTQPRLFDATGADITNSPEARERLIACVNGMAGVWLAETHVQEVDRRLREIEKLREEAWEKARERAA